MSAKSTPGPWKADTGSGCKKIKGDKHRSGAHRQAQYVELAYTTGLSDEAEDAANAKLIAVAPDHALLLAAMAKGAARWEPFNLNARYPETDPGGGELVVNGMRYTTRLDEFGCPALNDALRVVLGRIP